MPNSPMYVLKQGSAKPLKLQGIHPKIHCKAIEWPLNYHQVMVRSQFRTPSKGNLAEWEWMQKCHPSIQLLVDYIILKKTRQMQLAIDM